MMELNKMPLGYQEFLKRLDENVKKKGTEQANIDCEECGQNVFVVGPTWVSTHVFMYPDAPHHTTKALCFNCINKALKEHSGKQISSELN